MYDERPELLVSERAAGADNAYHGLHVIPQLAGIELFGGVLPLHEEGGGDHLSFLDFRCLDLDARIAAAHTAGHAERASMLERNRCRIGILVADVAGHCPADAAIVDKLEQEFWRGAQKQLDHFGEVTAGLIEDFHEVFYQCDTTAPKLITLVYAEISSTAVLRYINAGHPGPSVFSRKYECFVTLDAGRLVSGVPIGLRPSINQVEDICASCPFKKIHGRTYSVNQLELLGKGDVLLLPTDGLVEHADGEYFFTQLEHTLACVSDLPARGIYDAVIDDVKRFAAPVDDISLVVIKRT